jgi:phospholipase C
VREPNISDFRRRAMGDLTSAFRFHEPARHAPTLPDTTGGYNLAQYEAANLPLPTVPTSDQTMPRQEPGQRPHVG